MRALFLVIAFVFMVAPSGVRVYGQNPQPSPAAQAGDPGITTSRVIGEVKSIDKAQIVLKTDAGSPVNVILSDATSYLRLAPGDTDLSKGTKITLADIAAGDRVLARGKVADDHKSVPARTVVVMTKGDIAKKQEAERAEWRRRGILGVISTIKPDTKEITISTRAAAGPQPVIIPVSEKLELKRYAPDSIKFSDAKPSAFDELKVGDQVRALGEKSTDGTHFTAERVVTGSFRTVAGTVTAIDAATGEIKITDLEKKQPLTIVIKQDAVLRKFPAAGEMGGMGFGRGPGAGGPPAAGQSPQGGQGQAAGRPQGGAPGGGPGGGPRGFNIQDMLERLPTISLADVKTGDTIIVSSTRGVDPARLTAISLVSGADTLLAMLAPRPQAGQAAPNPTAGLGSGI